MIGPAYVQRSKHMHGVDAANSQFRRQLMWVLARRQCAKEVVVSGMLTNESRGTYLVLIVIATVFVVDNDERRVHERPGASLPWECVT